MPNPPHTERSHLVVNVIGQPNVQPNFRFILNQHLESVVTDLETAYARTRTNPQPRPVQISINLAYTISEILAPNATPPFSQVPPDQINLVRSGNVRVEVQIGRLPFDLPAPDPEPEPQELFDTAARMLGSLISTVDINELPDDGKTCPVCTEPFSVGGGEGDDDDRPLVLRCGHVVGRKCIEQWILSRHNSCPLCRAEIFEPEQLR